MQVQILRICIQNRLTNMSIRLSHFRLQIAYNIPVSYAGSFRAGKKQSAEKLLLVHTPVEAIAEFIEISLQIFPA
jgi:hypothetical protein